jgi:hypothetical protein
MANSKSNIYPIQLQGAELNLNKYDAEIKQYSGFNKNNSPFVGGCLSNVFTKEEQISGGNDDNVYIDENGDIYRVDTTGLYKNEEKLVDYTGCDFIEREKIKVPYDDVIKAYSDKVFLRKDERERLYLNDVFIGYFRYSLEDFLATYSCGVWYHGKFIFACWCNEEVTSSDRCNRFVTLEKNSDGEYVLGNVNHTQRKSTYPGEDSSVSFSPISIIISNDYFEIMYSKVGSDNSQILYIYSGNFNSSVITEVYGDLGEKMSYSGDWNYLRITSSTAFSFDILSYPRNEFNYRAFKFNNTDSTRIALTTKLNAEECQQRLIFRPENVVRPSVSFSSINNRDLPPDCCAKTKLLPSSLINCITTVIKRDKYYYFSGFEGSIINQPSENVFEVVGGTKITIDNCNYVILINNGVVSGIAADKDQNKILVTDWNSVNECLITYVQLGESDDIDLLYGDFEGNYYILKKSNTPKLRKVYNQIITNALYNYNCWFIDKKKKGCYATGFNCSPKRPTSWIGRSQASMVSKYVASAINEYNLEDNASILLNPFQCVIFPDPEILNFLNIDTFETTEGATPVYSRTYISYGGTYTGSYVENDKVGLPYPSDTNGNITYSPNIFSEVKNIYGNNIFIKDGNTFYPLIIGNNSLPVMSFFIASGINNLNVGFIIQGQFYGVMNNSIYNLIFNNGVVTSINFIVDTSNLQFVGNTPYEALFFSKTNRCLYSFTGANVLNQKQLVDKISEVRNYLYNPATQTVFLITDIGVLFYGLFGMFLLDYTNITSIFLLNNGIVMSDNNGNYRYIKYYLDEGDTDYEKQNIRLETSFYGMNNEMVTINDCLYFRLFSEEHEEGSLKVSATTISLSGRKTEETTFKIKASDWDKITHTIYLRYQPKTQRGLGVAFAIDSPFKIASMSVGSQPDAVLVDKVSKGAITAPSVTTNNNEW